MENDNKIEEKEGILERLCGLGMSFGLAGFHSINMYRLMDQAGMYDPSYHVPSSIACAAILGTASLFFGGLYVGAKIPKLIPRLINKYFNAF